MTDVTSTPPALRWVALFLAACAVLGLFLGFRDQIRKNPPGWYTGAEQIATPLATTTDGAREAVAFDPSAARPAPAATAAAPAPKAADTRAATPVDGETPADEPPAPKIAPPVLTPTPTPAPMPKARATPPATKAAPSADPVGDILEGQKQAETPAAAPVPY